MDDARSPFPATPRRYFLRVMALAPAFVAGCAGTRAAAPPPDLSNPAAPGAAAPDSNAPSDPLGPLRTFPLALDAEPAFVFRAHPARPGA
jgi:hypothetical protein